MADRNSAVRPDQFMSIEAAWRSIVKRRLSLRLTSREFVALLHGRTSFVSPNLNDNSSYS
jgi:hypothetical protein